MATNLIIDISNIAWATRFSEFKKNNIKEFSASLLMHSIISSLITNYMKFKPDGVILAFDGKDVWRRDIFPDYKINRKKDMFYEEVIETLNNIRELFSNHTDITVVSVPHAEADDVIYTAKHLSEKSVIISSDKDFVQLLDANTRLYASTLDKERTTEDAAYDLFLKCIRGDTGDNIPSAYPRVRETKLKSAYEDTTKLEYMNLMETVLANGDKVADRYNLNRKLIDISLMPQPILNSIIQNIVKESVKPKKYKQLNLIKALGQFELKKLAQECSSRMDFYESRFIVNYENFFGDKA